jgi:hypothetical protein
MSGVIVRGQSVNWPMSFWDDDAETVPLDCTDAVLSIIQNSTGAVITPVWTDQVTGKAKLQIASTETRKMKPGRFGTFRVKLTHPDLGDIVYPNADLLVE